MLRPARIRHRPIIVVALILWGGAVRPATAQGLHVVSPKEGQVVRGVVAFQVAGDDASLGNRLAAVAWHLNGQDLTGPLTVRPFDWRWHSTWAYDGPAMVEAVALDAQGRVLAKSQPATFQVSNHGHDLRLVEPTCDRLRKHPVGGKLLLTFAAERNMTEQQKVRQKEKLGQIKPVEAIVLYIDGHLVHVQFGAPRATFEVDTTKLSNGEHLLRVTSWAFDQGVPPLAQLQLPFRVQNDRPAQAAPEASGGPAQVPSLELSGVPHFSRSGKVLGRYRPGESTWVRSMFTLSPQTVAADERLHARVREAAITSLETGFYVNPADGSNPPSLEAFQKGYDAWFDSVLGQPMKKLDFTLILTGDDICRTANELNNTVNGPWSGQAVQYAFRKVRDTGRVTCIEMVDEISFLWGDTPTPHDGRWQKRQPALSDDAFVRLMKILNGVEGRPPITWPVGGITGPEAAGNWMGNPKFSDYATQYWDVADWRRCYSFGSSLPQMKKWLDHVVLGRNSRMQRDKPQLLLVSTCGPWYGQGGAGRECTVPGDLQEFLNSQNNTDVTVAAQVMYAAARGMAGVRCYSFDSKMWKDGRARGEGQTGADPLETGTNRWAGMAAAFNLVAQLEPYLLGKPIAPPPLGEDFVTAARQTDDGRLVMAVNFSETPRSATVDLSRYQYSGPAGRPIVRHRLHGATIATERADMTGRGTVEFQPGEAVVWLLRSRGVSGGGHDRDSPRVRLTSPLPDATVAGEVTVAADTAEEGAVSRVEFFVDGTRLGERTASPYRIQWNTASVKTGTWHQLTAVAYDRAGNRSEARQKVRVAGR